MREMTNAKQYKAARAEAIRLLTMEYPGQAVTENEIDERTDDVLAEWRADAALHREIYGEPEETSSIESCDLYGTGEGRYHGVI